MPKLWDEILIGLAIVIVIINNFVTPICFKEQPDPIGTGIAIILVAGVLLKVIRNKKDKN